MESTQNGEVFTNIVLEVFKLSGLLVVEGDRLTKETGLTSARWKVLGALFLADQPMTVAKIAKTMGQTRQGVQRIADDMANVGIVEYRDNPHHKRAKYVMLTEKGEKTYKKLVDIQVPWAEEKSSGIDLEKMRTTLQTLQLMVKKFDT
ncbi:MAG: MarR family transcriptional regulator [Prosthecochloris sp.]|uniref:MarR family winged helix-turn-helix transcriptional regulator n=1 Tax=Prosthecochloris sp. ZM_2 TaxID=2045206 RepID=UPI000DF7A949|nr:MarR family transcriptional regulator [Prosthecochloris sp. ZM_2]MEC9486361.1 MarR family transcriptional regulator [Prosthecochloris sp.]RNA65692.1 MarR family transcriptional regulator [Prosthecochloris sp. ZM_2]